MLPVARVCEYVRRRTRRNVVNVYERIFLYRNLNPLTLLFLRSIWNKMKTDKNEHLN